MNPTHVPFLDLVAPHVELEQELTEVFQRSLRTAGFIGGPMLFEFEEEFARFCETRYAVGVNSGTDALRFALMAVGVKAGDAVITVPNTFIATTEAISQAGARPLFVDVDECTYNMDPRKLQEFLETCCTTDAASGSLVHTDTGTRVAAIVPVHLYGQMADMDPILALAEKYGLMVVEDACQAHGAEYFSREDCHRYKAGSMGQAAAFSFYPGKNLGACGEAGAITTNDKLLAEKCRMLRDHGQAQKYYHECEGYNGRLDAIQAGILTVKLRHLAEWNRRRTQLAARYDELLSEVEGIAIPPFEPTWSRAIHHLYVVRCQDRPRLQKHLADAGIGTGIHYPIPLHLQNAYRHLGYRPGDFRVTERVAPEILSLPMYPQMSNEQQDHVVETLFKFLAVRQTAKSAALFPMSAAG